DGQAEGDRGHDGEALDRDARAADGRRIGAARLRRRHLVRPVRPSAPAGRRDGAAEPRLRRRPRVARAEGADGDADGRAGADHAGAVRRVREDRAGEIRARREGERDPDRLKGRYSPRYAARTFGSLSSAFASPVIVTSPESIT